MAVAASLTDQHTGRAEKSGFVMVPTPVARDAALSDGAFRTYCVIRSYCYGHKNHCWPSMRTLAAQRGCTEETIRRHLRELEAAGLIVVYRSGRRNVYVLRDWAGGAGAWLPSGAGQSDCPGASKEDCGDRHSAGLQEPRHAAAEPLPVTTAAQGQVRAAPMAHPGCPGGGEMLSSPYMQPHKDEAMGAPVSQHNAPVRGEKAHADVDTQLDKVCEESTTPPGGALSYNTHNTRRKMHPTARRLIQCGVSPSQARRLVERHGHQLCEQAIELLRTYLRQGAQIRNPGGWLYCAVTQGYLAPWDVRPQGRPGGPAAGNTGQEWGEQAVRGDGAWRAGGAHFAMDAGEECAGQAVWGEVAGRGGLWCGEMGVEGGEEVPETCLSGGFGSAQVGGIASTSSAGRLAYTSESVHVGGIAARRYGHAAGTSTVEAGALREITRRRQAALAARGVTPEADALWQQIVSALRAEGRSEVVLALSYLRPADGGGYVVECLVPALSGRLKALEGAIEAVARRVAEAEVVVR